MPVDFFVALGAIGSGITIAQASKNLASRSEMLRQYVKNGAHKIAILGAGGVGKTSLSLLLSGKPKDILFEYKASQLTERQKLGRNVVGEFIVGPGQGPRLERQWTDIQRGIINGKVKGIINVVAYGYHSIEETKISEIELYKKGMTTQQFVDAHTNRKRQLEIALLTKIQQSIEMAKRDIWMLTVVTKQDLWWNDNVGQTVEMFYKSGEYHQIIATITKRRGTDHFQHEYVSMSPVINNFMVGQSVLKPNAAGYDQRLQLANTLNMLDVLEGFIKS